MLFKYKCWESVLSRCLVAKSWGRFLERSAWRRVVETCSREVLDRVSSNVLGKTVVEQCC